MKILKLRGFAATLLSAAVIACSFALSPTTALAAGGRISYTFTGDEKSEPGYAQGKIKLSSLKDGSYYLYWADDKKALSGFYEIAQVEVKSGRGSFEFSDHAAIPPDAKKLIATSSQKSLSVSKAAAVYDIPAQKLPLYSSKDSVYSFMAYSDIHIDTADNQFYKYSGLHWEKALKTAAFRGADFIVTAGDNITNAEGAGKEYDKFQEILAASDYSNPVYEAGGNHELRTGSRKALIGTFVSATGLDGKRATIEKNKPYYTFEEPKTGDLFIMMALENKYDPQTGDEFSDEQLSWLKRTLEENYGNNKNIYILQHALIEGYGAGDDEDNYYKVPLSTKYSSTNRFKEIIEAYPEAVWISGHTHIAFKYGYNYSNMNDTSCHMIHDSSVCCPTTLNRNSHNLSYAAHDDEELKDMSEGYYVQAFDDRIIFYGENLYHDKIYPSACYVIEGNRLPLDKNNAPQAEKATFGSLPKSEDMQAHASCLLELPKSFLCREVTAADVEVLRQKTLNLLENYYTYSSYNQYQALKCALNSLQEDSRRSAEADYKSLSAAYLDFLPYTLSGKINLYFVNTKGWDKVYARLWSAKNETEAPGEEMTKIGSDSEGYPVYKIKLDYNLYKQVVFSDGGEEFTEEQTLSGEDNQMITANSHDPSVPYFCLAGKYTGGLAAIEN